MPKTKEITTKIATIKTRKDIIIYLFQMLIINAFFLEWLVGRSMLIHQKQSKQLIITGKIRKQVTKMSNLSRENTETRSSTYLYAWK